MNPKPKILVFYNYPSSFYKKEIDLLRDDYRIAAHDFYADQNWKLIFRFISQKLFILWHIWSADLALCQFGGYSSLLPVIWFRLLGKKVFVSVGGTEAHYFPGIGYGSSRKPLNRLFVYLSLKYCTQMLPKHQTLIAYDYTYDSTEPAKQGIYNLYDIHTPFTAIPNGFDPNIFAPMSPKQTGTFVTVAMGWQFPFQIQLKGIDLFVDAARRFPQCNFTIIGITDNALIQDPPSNLVLMPPVANKDLCKVLSGYEFYMQLSMAEGFSNSICEAMLCGCIPIASNVFSMQEIVGDTGFILMSRDRDLLAKLIEEAVQSNKKEELSRKARQRIIERYTLEHRKKLLLAALRA